MDFDDDITITLGDTIYTSDCTFTLGGTDDSLVYTSDKIGDWLWDELNSKPSITIGKQEITEETVEKLKALLDVIKSLEDNNDLKTLFNTQLAFNRISNTDENQSN